MNARTQYTRRGCRHTFLSTRTGIGQLNRFRVTLPVLMLSIHTLTAAYANQDRLENDPRYIEYNIKYNAGNFESAEALMRELYRDYPRDATPKIALALLLLKTEGRVHLCEAVYFLEEALAKGEVFFSRKLLDEIYGGNWSVIATIERSEVAREFLSREIEESQRSLQVLGLTRDDVISLDSVDRIPDNPVLCNRKG